MTRIPNVPIPAPPASAALPSPETPINPLWVFTETEAAKLLRLSRRTLQRLRLEGGGPNFVRLTPAGSRIGYVFSEIQAWLRERNVSSTSAATVANQGASARGGAK